MPVNIKELIDNGYIVICDTKAFHCVGGNLCSGFMGYTEQRQYISRVNSYNPKWNNCNTSINCFIPKKRSVKDSLEFYSVKYCIASTRLLSILTSRCRWLPVTRPVCPT